MILNKCFEVWAGTIFLGYEYAENPELVISKSEEKFKSPTQWGVPSFTVKQLTKDT